MFLEQINRRTEERLRNRAAQHVSTPVVGMTSEGKTIAIKAPPGLYERLQAQMQRHGVKTIKEMVFVAAQVGLQALEADAASGQ